MKFYIVDAFPNLPLSEIRPLSAQAQSWLARASRIPGFPEARSVQIAGAVKILSGLDYHHHQFMMHFGQLAPHYERLAAFKVHSAGDNVSPPMITQVEREHLDALDHEASAYLNRLGQFYYFARSMKLLSLITHAVKLVQSFRHQHTAHRSIDMSEKSLAMELKEMQAMTSGFYHLNNGSFPIFQIYDTQEGWVMFHMQNDHPIIMDEAMRLFERICYVPC